MSEDHRLMIGASITHLRRAASPDLPPNEREAFEAGIALLALGLSDLNRIADALERLAATFEERHA